MEKVKKVVIEKVGESWISKLTSKNSNLGMYSNITCTKNLVRPICNYNSLPFRDY